MKLILRVKSALLYIVGILLYPFMRLLVKAIKVNDKDEIEMISTYMKNINTE